MKALFPVYLTIVLVSGFTMLFNAVVYKPLPNNNKLVTYVDHLNSYWGAEKVAASIGVPGYSEPKLYNVINLAFLLNYGEADAGIIPNNI